MERGNPNTLAEFSEKQIRQPKRALGRRRIAVGKENLCVLGNCIPEVSWGSPSPLPEGYPRVPLQDITTILSPENEMMGINVCQGPRQRKKRRKAGLNITTPTVAVSKNSRGELFQCLPVGGIEIGISKPSRQTRGQTAKTESQAVGVTNAHSSSVQFRDHIKEIGTEVAETQAQGAAATAKMELEEKPKSGKNSVHDIKMQKRRNPAPVSATTNSRVTSNVMKIR